MPSAPIAERLMALAALHGHMECEVCNGIRDIAAELQRVAGEMRNGADLSEEVDWDLHEWADALASVKK